jgi:hypothetical protein
MVSEIGLLALIQHGIVKQATMAESGIGGGVIMRKTIMLIYKKVCVFLKYFYLPI